MTHRIDETIKACIIQQLNEDSRIETEHIQVEVEQGVAVLKGETNNRIAAQYAGQIALNTPGVTQVKNDLLTAYSDTGLAESDITKSFQLFSSAILHADMSAEDVDDSVEYGEVTMKDGVFAPRDRESI